MDASPITFGGMLEEREVNALDRRLHDSSEGDDQEKRDELALTTNVLFYFIPTSADIVTVVFLSLQTGCASPTLSFS